MNVSSSSSPLTSSPVNTIIRPRYPGRPSSAIQQHPRSNPPPSVIPLDYNYNYQSMAPSLNFHFLPLRSPLHGAVKREAAESEAVTSDIGNNYDQDFQYNSLFGDPILPPPPEAFSVSTLASSIFRPQESRTLEDHAASKPRLFSQEPYTSLFGRKFSNSTIFSTRSEEASPPRLKPPDIHILPNSSTTSNSETHNSPNSTLLMPQDIFTKSSRYQNPEESRSEEVRERADASLSRRMSSILENRPDQLNSSR